MPRYVLDTSMVLGYLRKSDYAVHVEHHYSPLSTPNMSLVSIVTNGELRSLALQFQWGEQRIMKLHDLLHRIAQVDIHDEIILQRYAEIDAFSQGKHTSKRLPTGMSARNMGKNDIWISATASVLDATLLTTDNDFNHLSDVFLSVITIDPKMRI